MVRLLHCQRLRDASRSRIQRDSQRRRADRYLAADPRLPLDRPALDALLADRLSFTGMAGAQVADVADRVAKLLDRFGDAAAYNPEPIL